MPSQTELDTAKATFARAKADEASAKAAVAQAQATLDGHQTDITKAVIRSPINGVVLTRSVEPGQTVAASFQAPVLFTLAEDLTQMELHVDVDEADVGQVKEGQEATFTVDAYPDRTFPARITQVRYGSKTVDGVVTYKTVLKVDNSDLCPAAGHDGHGGDHGQEGRRTPCWCPMRRCGSRRPCRGRQGAPPAACSARCSRARPCEHVQDPRRPDTSKTGSSRSGPCGTASRSPSPSPSGPRMATMTEVARRRGRAGHDSW